MAIRGGLSLDLIWVHFTTSGLDITDLRARVNAKLDTDPRLAACVASITFRIDNAELLVKVNATLAWVNSLPGNVQNKILRVFTEADHHEAVAMVQSPAWAASA